MAGSVNGACLKNEKSDIQEKHVKSTNGLEMGPDAADLDDNPSKTLHILSQTRTSGQKRDGLPKNVVRTPPSDVPKKTIRLRIRLMAASILLAIVFLRRLLSPKLTVNIGAVRTNYHHN